MLKFYARHGMVVDKIPEIISFKQSMWLEKYIIFTTQKRNKANNEFERISTNHLIVLPMERQWKMYEIVFD